MNRSPDALDSQAQAAEWLIRLDADHSAAMLARWRCWVSEDARHHAAYRRLETSWQQTECLKSLRPLDGPVNAGVLDTFPGERTPLAAPAPAPPPRPCLAATYRTLAAVLAVTTLVLATWLVMTPGGGVHRTEVGGLERVLLPDDSAILLNTDSEIRVRFSGTHREIALTRGEALFNVAHDEQRPFDVKAGNTTVRAVGTSFAVRLRAPREIEVLVTKGRVAIDPESSLTPRATLAVGADAVIEAGRQPRVQQKDAEGITHQLAWTQGQLWFKQQTLTDAIAEFNRYNRRQLILADPALATIRVGGSFDATDPDAFVAALERVFAIRALSSPATDSGAESIRLLGLEPRFR